MLNQRIIIVALVVVFAVSGLLLYRVYGSGTLVVKVTDPPRDWGRASNVYIRFEGFQVHRNDWGWIGVVEETGWIDLKEALNASKTLGSSNLRSGRYNLIRFYVADAMVTADGINHTARVENDFLTVTILQGGVTIESGQTSTVTIDITPKVITQGSQGYRLVPAAQAFPN
jgi:hypothetical protein